MKQKVKPKIDMAEYRDLRETHWSWFQDELLDVFAPLVGPLAVLVYISICRKIKANQAVVQISSRDIAKMWDTGGFQQSISKTSVLRALKLLRNAGMLVELQAATKRAAPIYGLRSLPKLAQELTAEQCDNLARVFEQQKKRLHLPQKDLHNSLLKTSGKACGNAPLSTDDWGPLEVPKHAFRGPQGTSHLINKEIHKKEHKPPSPREAGEPDVDSALFPPQPRAGVHLGHVLNRLRSADEDRDRVKRQRTRGRR
jgi:hypothetical protein